MERKQKQKRVKSAKYQKKNKKNKYSSKNNNVENNGLSYFTPLPKNLPENNSQEIRSETFLNTGYRICRSKGSEVT